MKKIAQKDLDLEMKRRHIRKEQRKQIDVTTQFNLCKKNGETIQKVNITQKKTKLSQIIHQKPFTIHLLEDMIAHNSYGPWWRSKIHEILRMDQDLVSIYLTKLGYSPYKSGTVEYWENLMWGSRRKRDKFIDQFFFPKEEDDEIAVTQGDEPVLEEVSNLSGNANITFVEERPTDSDSTHVNGSVSTQDPHNNMGETSWNQVKMILERETVIESGSWTPTTTGQFLSFGIPKCSVVRPNSFVRQQLKLFAFLRSGYEVRIQFNGNRFALGSLLFAVVPPMFEEDVSNYTPEQLFNFPHVRIDASVSNVGTLFVPFTHLLSHFPQREGSLESDSICTLGRLVGVVINPLLVGDGASNKLRWTIYGRFVNPEVHQTTWPIEKFSYSDGVFAQGADEGLFKKIVGGGLSTALGSFLSKMTGGLATGIGSVLAGLIFDYPRDPMPGEPIVNTSVGPTCYGAGIDHSVRLALTPVSQTETPTSLLGSTNGDFDLKVLLQIPSLVESFVWNAAHEQGWLLYTMPVTPSFIPSGRIKVGANKTTYTPTMQAYISRAFCYWRGTIKVKFQFIKTEYNNGRVLVTYSPHINANQMPGNVVLENIDVFNQANAVVIDIEEQKEIEIELPYMSIRPWLRCDAFRPRESFAGKNTENSLQTFLGESHCGFLTVHVMNSLVSPSNVPQDIQVNVLISVGDDFELAYPTTLTPLNITSFGIGSAGSYEEYPFVISKPTTALNDVNFENKEWITAAYHEGQRLFVSGRIFMPDGKTHWYQAEAKEYRGTTDEETLIWLYRVAILQKYRTMEQGDANAQSLYMDALGTFKSDTRFEKKDKIAVTQALEEYTTNRVSGTAAITATKGHRMCEVAPQTVSENAMNLQTVLRRYYCIYTSPQLYNYSGFTMVSIPVNPSFTPVARAPITTRAGSFYAEPVPTDHVAWFTKLFSYWRGSLRYKVVYDANFFDVNVVHVPTECNKFEITTGVKEVDVTRIMTYAGIVATAQTQAALEVEVPYASPYNQLLIDVHNKYYDLRTQNGTLFFLFRNKIRGSLDEVHPTSFQIYRSTGDDFVMNVPRSPPQVDEPKIVFGACAPSAQRITSIAPEAVRNLGNDSQKVTKPKSTGIKYVTSLGTMQYCEPEDPPVKGKQGMAVAQGIFDGAKEVTKKAEAIVSAVDPQKVETIVSNLESTTTAMNSLIVDGKLKETMASLNEFSSKLDTMLGGAMSAANGINTETIKKYAIIASEVLLCGTFVHQVRTTLVDPTLPNFITLGVELGLIVGLSVSETLQSLIASVVDWAMNFPILPKLPQAQVLDGATDFLEQNQNIICSVVAVLGTVLYAFLFDVIPSFDKIKAAIKNFFESDDEAKTQGIEKALGINLRNAHFSVLGLSALDKVFTKITEWVQKLLYWFMDQENPEVMLARTSAEVRDRVLALISELDELDYEPNFIASLTDPLIHNRYYRIQDEVQELTATCTKSKVDVKVVNLLTECRRRAQKMLQRMEKENGSNTTRYDPFVVCLHGDYGVGKTAFAFQVLKIYQEVMNLPKFHLLFPKQIHDKYWSGYTNQPVVLWDEFGQSVEADKVAVPEFMTLRGSRPVKVNMSADADKGRNFTSQGIIMTTNVPYVNYNSIRDNGALCRRRHVMVGMQMAQGYDANAVSRLTKDQYETYDHAVFAITGNMEHNVLQADLGKQEVLDFIRQEMTVWHEKQMDILSNLEADELPRGVVAVDQPIEVLRELRDGAAIEINEHNDAVAYHVHGDEEYFWDADGLPMEPGVNPIYVPDEEEEAEVQTLEALQELFPELAGGKRRNFYGELLMFQIDPTHIWESADERFIAEHFLSKMETARAAKILATYYKAKTGVAKTASRLYNLAKSIFDSLIEKVLNFWQNNQKLCKILGILGLLGSIGTIMHFRTRNEVEAYESGPSRSAGKRVIPETYDNGPNRAPKRRVIAEGSEDLQAMEISRKLKGYVYPIAWSEGMTRSCKMNAFHIAGHLIVAPAHFFAHALEGEWFELRHRNRPVKIEFIKSRMFQIADKDWVVYDCGIRLEAAQHLMKFFIREQNLDKIRNGKCMLITRDPVDWEVETKHGMVKPKVSFKYEDPRYGEVYQQSGWEHNIDTQAGHCGGPLMIVDPAVPSPGKILGIHVAGFKTKSIGYVVLITHEQIMQAVQHFGVIPTAAPIAQCVERGISEKMRIIPEGDFTIVGKMPDKMSPAQPLKTTLEETPFFAEVVKDFGPPQKKPAQLKKFVKDGETISPLKKAIVKYGHLTIPYPRRNLKKVQNFLVHLFDQKLVHHTGKRVFTIPEAVNGLPGVEFAERLNMKSSPGWPYQIETKEPGKWYLFDSNGNIVNEELKQRLHERMECAKRKERVPSIWRDCLKDELRPIKKVEEGKTRLFTIAPVDFTILARQMFFDFVMAFYSAQSDSTFFSAVGINPESMDWTRLFDSLAAKNHETIAGDYECFDGKEMPEVIEMVGQAICAWYGGSEEDCYIRETLFEEIIHTMQLCENTVYMTHQGNPSGNPLTTVINTIVNFALMALTWLEIFPEKSVDEFHREVCMKAYGDDNELTVAPKCQDRFHQNSIAQALLEHNIVYTSEAKTETKVANFRPLTETTFLKRGFRRDNDFGKSFVLPTMSIETLNSYFYYVRKSPDIQSQLQENQRSALIFAAFHGREFYEEYLGKWKRYMKSANLESLQISFEEQIDAFLYNAGVLEKPSLTRNEKGLIPEGFERFMKISNSKPVRFVGGAIEAPFYCLAASLGLMKAPENRTVEDDRWAVAIPSGEGKSYLTKNYPWLFADHDELLLPKFSEKGLTSFPWKAATASEVDFPKQDRRVLLVHHPNNTKRRLVGSFITPFPTFIRMNCIQRLQMDQPIKMERNQRNLLLVQVCSSLEPTLCRNNKRTQITEYTEGPSCLNQPVGLSAAQNAQLYSNSPNGAIAQAMETAPPGSSRIRKTLSLIHI